MKKLKLAVLTILVSQILPLLGKPELIIHYKNLVILAGNATVWLYHPAVSKKETSVNRSSDKNSVLLIIIMSLISTIVPLVDWAYFSNAFDSNLLITILGFIVMWSGILLRNYSVKILGEHFTPTIQIQRNHALIKKGPYSIIRHPSYTGAMLALVGNAIFLNSALGVGVAIIAMLIAYKVRIDAEEYALKEKFGNLYSEYQSQTKKLIPGIW